MRGEPGLGVAAVGDAAIVVQQLHREPATCNVLGCAPRLAALDPGA